MIVAYWAAGQSYPSISHYSPSAKIYDGRDVRAPVPAVLPSSRAIASTLETLVISIRK